MEFNEILALMWLCISRRLSFWETVLTIKTYTGLFHMDWGQE